MWPPYAGQALTLLVIGLWVSPLLALSRHLRPEQPTSVPLTHEEEYNFSRLLDNEVYLKNGVHVVGTAPARASEAEGQIVDMTYDIRSHINGTDVPDDDEGLAVYKAILDRQKGKGNKFGVRNHRPKRGIAITDETKYWTNGIVPYVYDTGLSDEAKKHVIYAMWLVEQFTCVRFVPWNSTTKDAYGLANDGRLKFIDGSSGCWSFLGNDYAHFNGGQPISCCYLTLCIHEIGHALGLRHEHAHYDNKDWLRKNWFKQSNGMIFSYAEHQEGTQRFEPYDISSPMHYAIYYPYSEMTLLFPELKIHTEYLYFFRLIADIYQCKEHNCSSFSIPCQNEGFVTMVKGQCSCYCPLGLDPNTGCTTARIKLEKIAFPGGSYAFPSPREGCPAGHGFETAVVSHTYAEAHQEASAVQGSIFHGNGTVTTRLCVRNSPYNNAVKWPLGEYCIYRVGVCPLGFKHSSITFETIPGGNSGNFSEVEIGDDYVTFHYCCRFDGIVDNPIDLPNTQSYILLRTSRWSCPIVTGMGLAQEQYMLKDPKVSMLYNASNKHLPRFHRHDNGAMYFDICYLFPLTDNPFPPPSCEDGQENCASQAHNGHCDTSSQVADNCPYSCDTCTGATNGTDTCMNSDLDCEPGLCSNYSASKREACSFTCRLCPEFCGGIINLTRANPSQEITSPNFPNPYNNSVECYWLISGPPDTTILLTFSAFDLEGNIYHCADNLEINHGLVGQEGLHYCGQNIWETIRSIYNHLEMRFTSNFQNQRVGFNATARLQLPEDHCFHPSRHGQDYRGNVSYTRDWTPCVSWNETRDCRHHAYAPADLLDDLDENFCRNPGNGIRPWCYTNTKCDRNYCDVCFLETEYDTDTDCETFKAAGHCNRTEEARQKCARTCADELPPRTRPEPYTTVKCGPPSPPTDAASGYNLTSEYAVGQNVSFTCKDNANFSRVTTCLANGQWSHMGYVCGGCPDGWTFHNNHCFIEFTTAMTYDNARAHCLSLQAQVAEARTEEDIRFLVVLKDDGHSQWMALRKDPDLCFIWEDRTRPSWTKWDSSASVTKDCTVVLPTLKWTTSHCSNSYHMFVCQKPAQASSICADYLPDCARRVQPDPSLCDDEHDFAKFSCPKTCYRATCQDPCASSPCLNGGKCYVNGETFQCVCSKYFYGDRCENKTAGLDSCQDKICGCSLYEKDCHSGARHYILANCPRTCGLCNGTVSPCSDNATNCTNLTPSQCQDDPDNMFQQCRKSCGYCVDGPTCVDRSDQCSTLIDQDTCATNDTVKRLCPHGCNLCFNPHCYDKDVDCQSLANDYCLDPGAKPYMDYNCAYSCHTCSLAFKCYSHPCKNGGTCIEDSGAADGYTCDCSGTGFRGPACEYSTSLKCGPPSPPADAASGYNLTSEYAVGENVSFTCKDNANLSRVITCLIDGHWPPLGLVCQGCLDGWTFHDNHCFIKSTTAMTYDNARAHCLGLQAQVAEARTEEDITFLVQLKNDSQSQWMALRKDPDLCFIWEDRTQPSWTKWDSSANIGLDCTVVLSNQHWSTSDCSNSQHMFVCQRPAQVSSVCADNLPDCANRTQHSPSLCHDDPDFAKLSCPKTCYGETCQDPCHSSPCVNGGKCSVHGGTFQCVCSKNFYGTRCENETDTSGACQDTICGCSIHKSADRCNGGTRHYILGLCPRTCGLCDGNISPCADNATNCTTLAPSQCQENPDNMFQQCRKSCEYCVDGPTCVDRSDNCSTLITPDACDTNDTVKRLCPHGCNLCFNPHCIDRDGNCVWWALYYCTDPSYQGYMEHNCAYSCHKCSSTFKCYSHPCRNGGTCSENAQEANGYTCDCSETGFTGPNCEQPILRCSSQPCNNNGTCSEDSGAADGYTCDCSGTGFTGPRCEEAVPQCAQGWQLSEGSCYKYFDLYKTFAVAQAVCSSSMAGANITTARTASENDLIYNISGGVLIWINARKYSNDAGFQWPDGSLVSEGTYTNWANGEPNGEHKTYTNVKCAFQRSWDGKWKDYPCDQKRKTMCKYPAT